MRREEEERRRKAHIEREMSEKRLNLFKPSKFFEIWKRREEVDREISY